MYFLATSKKQRHYFANKGPSSQGYGFSSGHVRMWELDYKESWAPKNWCFWTVVLEKTLESPLDCKEIQQPILKEMSPGCSLEGLMLKLKLQYFGVWPPHAKSWLIWKDLDAGKDWGQEEKGTTEDEMVGWHHRLDGHGFGWTPGVGDGQGGLVCCGSWGHKESDTTERLNWTELMPRADSFEKTLMLGKTEGRRRRGRQRMKWLDGINNSMEMSLSKLQELVNGQAGLVCCGPWDCEESDTTEWLNWTEGGY